MFARVYKQLAHLLSLLLLSVLIQSCTHSSLTSSWTNQSFEASIKGPILVIGAFKDPTAHKIYEDSFVESLVQSGAEAIPSYNYGQGTTRHSKEWLHQVIQQSRATAVLITHLRNEKITTEKFSPEGLIIGGIVVGNDIQDYQSYVVEDTIVPGNTVTKTVDHLVATLFDVQSSKAIWSAHEKDVNLNHFLRKDDEKMENIFIKDMERHHLLSCGIFISHDHITLIKLEPALSTSNYNNCRV